MRRICARPGCPQEATTTLSYDYRERAVWLDALLEEPHPMMHDLCHDHAETLSVPRGWLLRDQRPTVTALFPNGEPAPTESAPSDAMGALSLRRTASA